MVNSQYKVNYEGIEQDFKIESFTHNMMDQLVDSAPSDSFFNLVIRKNENEEFESRLDLSSRGLQFSVNGCAQSPFVSLDQVWVSAKDQITGWCYNRFDYAQ